MATTRGKIEMNEKGVTVSTTDGVPMIYGLIQQAMQKIRAIGKDGTAKNLSGKEMFKFRGIDAVYNALNPVMSELGLFVVPNILDQTREERQTTNGGRLVYTILTIRYTLYAPDGSNIEMTVIGEGMDSGDKSANKAMSIGLKYAMFQLFMIPTEDVRDPDADVYDNVLPENHAISAPVRPANGLHVVEQAKRPETASQGATVAKVSALPPIEQEQPAPAVQTPPRAVPESENPVKAYLLKAMKQLREDRGITVQANNKLFADQTKALISAGLAPDKKTDEYTMQEAEELIDAMYKNFPPTSAVMNKPT